MGILLSAEAGAAAGGGIIMVVYLVLIFGFLYFFMIRPQNKKQKEIKKAREAMQTGDKVVTAGGIHGKIKEITDDTIILEIAPGVSIKVDKASVYPAVSPDKTVKK